MPAKTFDRYPLVISDRDGKNPRPGVRVVRLGGTVILLGLLSKHPTATKLSTVIGELDRFPGQITTVRGSRGAWLITTDDGREILAKKDPSGCSCGGDPVRSYRLRG